MKNILGKLQKIILKLYFINLILYYNNMHKKKNVKKIQAEKTFELANSRFSKYCLRQIVMDK